MAETWKIIKLTIDHGTPEVSGVEGEFADRDAALAAWETPGRYIQTPSVGPLYYYQHILVVERDGRHYTAEGEAIRGIPELM